MLEGHVFRQSGHGDLPRGSCLVGYWLAGYTFARPLPQVDTCPCHWCPEGRDTLVVDVRKRAAPGSNVNSNTAKSRDFWRYDRRAKVFSRWIWPSNPHWSFPGLPAPSRSSIARCGSRWLCHWLTSVSGKNCPVSMRYQVEIWGGILTASIRWHFDARDTIQGCNGDEGGEEKAHIDRRQDIWAKEMSRQWRHSSKIYCLIIIYLENRSNDCLRLAHFFLSTTTSCTRLVQRHDSLAVRCLNRSGRHTETRRRWCASADHINLIQR